jgi:hypothetical protein
MLRITFAAHRDPLAERRVEDRLSHVTVEDLLPHLLGELSGTRIGSLMGMIISLSLD